ncbi:MAG: hypothetical protein GY696_09700 [Gammaproteobacteria bacterium]|nr:hypothetical protein [Gammaproteobacteria bacterium]
MLNTLNLAPFESDPIDHFKEQYGRYIPNVIKNQKWNLTRVGRGRKFTTSLHRQIHGAESASGIRLRVHQRLWYGSNVFDKAIVAGGAAAAAEYLDE